MGVYLIEKTPENQDAILQLCLSMYLWERCKFCGRTYETLDDLKDTVWAGYHEYGRLADKQCWNLNVRWPKWATLAMFAILLWALVLATL